MKKKEKHLTKENATETEYKYLLSKGIDLEEENLKVENRIYYDLDDEDKESYEKNGVFCQDFVLKEKELKYLHKWVVISEG